MKQVAVGAIVLAALLPIGSCQKTEDDYPPPGGGDTSTDQGWDYGTAQSWYHVDQGTAFFPYDWFVALEQAQGQERFAAPGNMQRFGFLSNPPHQTYNPDGLPIGFSRTELQLDKGAFQCWQGDWVGLTCAACHTGQVNYHGTTLLIEGGPAQSDIETFRLRLADAVGAVATDPQKAQRFVGRVLARRPDLTPAAVQASLQCFGQASAARVRIEREALAKADEPPTGSGFARLDALGRGANFLFAESTGMVENYKPTTAPVSYPHLWDTPVLRLGAVQQLGAAAAFAQHRRGDRRRRPDRSRDVERAGAADERPDGQSGRHPAVAAGPEVAAVARRRPRRDRPRSRGRRRTGL